MDHYQAAPLSMKAAPRPEPRPRTQQRNEVEAGSYHEAVRSVNRSAAGEEGMGIPRKGWDRGTVRVEKGAGVAKGEESRPAHGFRWPVGS